MKKLIQWERLSQACRNAKAFIVVTTLYPALRYLKLLKAQIKAVYPEVYFYPSGVTRRLSETDCNGPLFGFTVNMTLINFDFKKMKELFATFIKHVHGFIKVGITYWPFNEIVRLLKRINRRTSIYTILRVMVFIVRLILGYISYKICGIFFP